MTSSDEPGTSTETVDNPLSRLINELASSPELVSVTRYAQALATIRAWLKRYGSLSSEDADDVTSEVLSKLTARVKEHGPLLTDAYVYATAKNATVDFMRRGLARAREFPFAMDDLVAYELVDDDAVSSAFEAAETAATITDALRKLRLAGDQVAYLVVTTALDETQRRGKRPSNRMLAEQLKVSHTTVNNALNRFRPYLSVDQFHNS